MPIDAAQLEPHRAALTGHCYRMLGSAGDAQDAVQETLIRAWRHADGFDGRSALRTWLYRIATNVCLDALADRAKRMRPADHRPPGRIGDGLDPLPEELWVEPIPDALAIPGDADPEERLLLRESIRLAFVAALQHLPPRQRAALLLTEVLNLSAAEAADTLGTSAASVNSALQRARATLAGRDPGRPAASLSASEAAQVAGYLSAFERYDVEALTALLAEDAVLSMPPYALWFRGRDNIRAWMEGPGSGCRGSRILPVEANGMPAFGQYRDGGRKPWALVVLEPGADGIVSMTSFLDTAAMFPLFGLPPVLVP